jgi:hypothetical protein
MHATASPLPSRLASFNSARQLPPQCTTQRGLCQRTAQACCPALRVCSRTALGPVAPGALKPPTCRLLAAPAPAAACCPPRQRQAAPCLPTASNSSWGHLPSWPAAPCAPPSTVYRLSAGLPPRHGGTARYTTPRQPSPAQPSPAQPSPRAAAMRGRKPQGARTQSGQPRAPSPGGKPLERWRSRKPGVALSQAPAGDMAPRTAAWAASRRPTWGDADALGDLHVHKMGAPSAHAIKPLAIVAATCRSDAA